MKIQVNTRHDKTRQDNTRHGMTRHGPTRHDKTRHDTTRRDTARPDKMREDMARQESTRQEKKRQEKTKQDKKKPHKPQTSKTTHTVHDIPLQPAYAPNCSFHYLPQRPRLWNPGSANSVVLARRYALTTPKCRRHPFGDQPERKYPICSLLLLLVGPVHIQAKNTDLLGSTFHMCR